MAASPSEPSPPGSSKRRKPSVDGKTAAAAAPVDGKTAAAAAPVDGKTAAAAASVDGTDSGPAAPRPWSMASLRATAEAPPVTVRAAAALTALEALALLGYAVAYPVQVLPLGDNAGQKALIAGGVLLFLLIVAAALLAAARSLLTLKRWSLSLIVVTQLVAIPVLLPAARDDLPVLWIAIAGAAAIIVLAFLPPTTAAVNQ